MTDKNAKNENSKIRIMTFFPPFIILVAFLVLSLVDQETFLGVINNINNWIIKNLGWAASILALAIVIVAVVAMFSKFGDVRIGGEDAKPELSNFSWFTIALTTTMAAGVLFWGPGEPIAHWTIVPYCMYTVPAVVFAFMYYNAKKPYSIASEVSPLLGDRCYHPRWMQTIDAITLFAIGAGMAGSVAQAFMNISGGISKMLGLPSNARLWFMVGIVVAAVTVATAVSGIQKAMKHVSNINVYGFAIFLIFLLIFSNASFLFNLSTEALGGFSQVPLLNVS